MQVAATCFLRVSYTGGDSHPRVPKHTQARVFNLLRGRGDASGILRPPLRILHASLLSPALKDRIGFQFYLP